MSLAPTTFAGIALLGLVACGSHKSGGMTGPTMNNRINAPAPPAAQSNEILERTPRTSEAWVKHILIGWRDLEPIYGAGMDPRARGRSASDALTLAKQLLARAKKGEVFEDLMKEYSEDRGSAAAGRSYRVHADAKLVAAFRKLGLRLDIAEIGVVRSPYGWHIMK